MDITHQICTLQQAVFLKEQGLTQNSLFYWNNPKDGPHGEEPTYGWTDSALASAYTASELGNFLPGEVFEFDGVQCLIGHVKIGGLFYCSIRSHSHEQFELVQTHGSTEASARANLIILLLNDGISPFTLDELNHRYNGR